MRARSGLELMFIHVLALLASTPGAAGFSSANEVLKACNSELSQEVIRCREYITGVVDTVRAYEAWTGGSEFCAPANLRVPQIRNAFVDFVRSRPDMERGQAASVLVLALRQRFPCPVSR
jgi:hypothetical protein